VKKNILVPKLRLGTRRKCRIAYFHPINRRRVKHGTMGSFEPDGFDFVGGVGVRQGPTHGGG
jgi:hypothetical protein